jgi:hypothetical protein
VDLSTCDFTWKLEIDGSPLTLPQVTITMPLRRIIEFLLGKTYMPYQNFGRGPRICYERSISFLMCKIPLYPFSICYEITVCFAIKEYILHFLLFRSH